MLRKSLSAAGHRPMSSLPLLPFSEVIHLPSQLPIYGQHSQTLKGKRTPTPKPFAFRWITVSPVPELLSVLNSNRKFLVFTDVPKLDDGTISHRAPWEPVQLWDDFVSNRPIHTREEVFNFPDTSCSLLMIRYTWHPLLWLCGVSIKRTLGL